MKILQLSTILYLFVLLKAQKNNNFVKGRNTIVHLFEWKWTDIAKECENFLGPRGFAGVQISPPSENKVIADRPWWERYQVVSYNLTTRSGNEQELADMIKRCNAVGVRIYADLIMNHMAGQSGLGTAGNTCKPGNKFFPAVPYNSNDFHSTCSITNYNNATNVRNCQLSGFPDLDQSKDNVRQKLSNYINHLIDLGVAGFRVDAAKHMWPKDLEVIYSMAKDLNTAHGFPEGSRPFFFQEVIDLGGEAVSKYEYTRIGNVLDYKYGFEISDIFQKNDSLHLLKNWGPEWGLLDSDDAVVYVDNHETQRRDDNKILSFRNAKPYRAAIVFMLAHPFYTTRLMSSYVFNNKGQGPPSYNGSIISPIMRDIICINGWVCEYRWRQFYQMVKFRNVCEGTGINDWWDNNGTQIAFSRGNKGFVAFRTGGEMRAVIKTSLPKGVYCDIISGFVDNNSCTSNFVDVDENGYATVHMFENEDDFVVAIHVNATL